MSTQHHAPVDRFASDDVILWLLPHKGEGFTAAMGATELSENKLRLFIPCEDPPKQRDIPREERAATEHPKPYGQLENTKSLVVRFSDGAKTSLGVVVGRAAAADLVLPNEPGISFYHLSITFDDENRPIVRDLGSTCGTKVTYGGEKGQRISHFDWPLDGPSIQSGRPPVLNIADSVQFRVIMPPHDYTSPEYINKVQTFRVGTADPGNLLQSLIIGSAQATQLPSATQTPSNGPTSDPPMYKQILGKGGFGLVVFVWNIKTREEYVEKWPRRKKFDINMWRREADILSSIGYHEHIVEFRRAVFTPKVWLEFEYIRGGSLDKHSNLSTLENTQVLVQLSSALDHLPNGNPPIAHRDIKPENILVAKRGAHGIHVKFADFGLSSLAVSMNTRCGTDKWTAPEILNGNEQYGVKVDIWSLGLVIASLECGLPEYNEYYSDWACEIRDHVEDKYDEDGGKLLRLLLENMLFENPDFRKEADDVHERAGELLNALHDKGSATPTPSTLDAQSYVESDGLEGKNTVVRVADAVTKREWPDTEESEVWQSQILQTTEAPQQGSSASSNEEDGEATFIAGSVGSVRGDENDGVEAGEAVEARRRSPSARKRTWVEEPSPVSLGRSSADQQRVTSAEPSDHKRSRRRGRGANSVVGHGRGVTRRKAKEKGKATSSVPR